MEYFLIIGFAVIIIAVIALWTIRTFNQIDIDEAVKKQQAEDARLRQKYNMTTYEDEMKRNDQLKQEYETLRLKEENKRLQEEVNRLRNIVENK